MFFCVGFSEEYGYGIYSKRLGVGYGSGIGLVSGRWSLGERGTRVRRKIGTLGRVYVGIEGMEKSPSFRA